MAATDQSVARSSAAALSSRLVSRYWCGDSPKVALNCLLKWAGDSLAAAARSATVSGSKYLASARSLARSRWRAAGTAGTCLFFLSRAPKGVKEQPEHPLKLLAPAVDRGGSGEHAHGHRDHVLGADVVAQRPVR